MCRIAQPLFLLCAGLLFLHYESSCFSPWCRDISIVNDKCSSRLSFSFCGCGYRSISNNPQLNRLPPIAFYGGFAEGLNWAFVTLFIMLFASVTPGFFDKDGRINREKGLLFDSVEGSSDTSKEILVFFLISMYVWLSLRDVFSF